MISRLECCAVKGRLLDKLHDGASNYARAVSNLTCSIGNPVAYLAAKEAACEAHKRVREAHRRLLDHRAEHEC
jgi:hypothetical protein